MTAIRSRSSLAVSSRVVRSGPWRDINLSVETKSGLNLESTNEIMAQLEEMVSQHPDVESYSMSVGSGGMMGSPYRSSTLPMRR